MRLKIYEIIGTNKALTKEQGKKVSSHLFVEDELIIDFKNVNIVLFEFIEALLDGISPYFELKKVKIANFDNLTKEKIRKYFGFEEKHINLNDYDTHY